MTKKTQIEILKSKKNMAYTNDPPHSVFDDGSSSETSASTLWQALNSATPHKNTPAVIMLHLRVLAHLRHQTKAAVKMKRLHPPRNSRHQCLNLDLRSDQASNYTHTATL